MRRETINGIDAEIAESAFERMRGLIGRTGLARGKGVLITKCSCIHTLFMRFPIDATFLDRKGNVVKVVRDIRPWRPWIWGGWRARSVLETAALKLLLVATVVLAGCCAIGDCDHESAAKASPNISVFANFVSRTAKERNISLEEAADLLYDLGVRGFDISPKDANLAELAATKLKPINFYVFPDMFAPDGGRAECLEFLDAAERYGVPRCMVVPSNFTKDGDPEAEFAKILASMRMIVAEAKRRGITITVEDFGGTSNPCSHAKYLRRFLDEIPDIHFALDSGNLYYAGRGEDILGMMAYAKGRIGHVHLKDQKPDDNRAYETLGLGAVPNERIVKAVHASGYSGWYTLENPVGGDTYTDTVRQVAVLKSWLSGK